MLQTETLGSISVLDLEGSPVPLGSLWRDQTTVLVFIRHFG